MSKILVTGASGHLGRLTLLHLLDRRPASELVGLARDPEKAADLADQGIEIRAGDYLDPASLRRAFAGVERMLLVPAPAFTDRATQHANVIAAAKEAGVEHLVYTPIIRKEGSARVLPQVTEPDAFTLDTLAASGLRTTILGHPLYLDSFLEFLGGDVRTTGVRAPAGDGKVAAASRSDLAEAQAVVLTEPGHEGRTYALHGSAAVSFADVAELLAVDHVPVSDEEYVQGLVAAGLPQPAAEFVLRWVEAVNGGEWDEPSGDLERLLGRRPTTAAELLRKEPVQG